MISFTKRDCPPDTTAIIRNPGTVCLGYIVKVPKCNTCGGLCWQTQLKSGRVEHHEKQWEAKDSAKKL